MRRAQLERWLSMLPDDVEVTATAGELAATMADGVSLTLRSDGDVEMTQDVAGDAVVVARGTDEVRARLEAQFGDERWGHWPGPDGETCAYCAGYLGRAALTLDDVARLRAGQVDRAAGAAAVVAAVAAAWSGDVCPSASRVEAQRLGIGLRVAGSPWTVTPVAAVPPTGPDRAWARHASVWEEARDQVARLVLDAPGFAGLRDLYGNAAVDRARRVLADVTWARGEDAAAAAAGRALAEALRPILRDANTASRRGETTSVGAMAMAMVGGDEAAARRIADALGEVCRTARPVAADQPRFMLHLRIDGHGVLTSPLTLDHLPDTLRRSITDGDEAVADLTLTQHVDGAVPRACLRHRLVSQRPQWHTAAQEAAVFGYGAGEIDAGGDLHHVPITGSAAAARAHARVARMTPDAAVVSPPDGATDVGRGAPLWTNPCGETILRPEARTRRNASRSARQTGRSRTPR